MGTPLETYAGETSEKSRGVALALVTLLGVFGGHRFYVGKTGTGILQAVTLGGAGLWWLYDLILVASGSFRDVNDRLVRRWDPEEAAAAGTLPSPERFRLRSWKSSTSCDGSWPSWPSGWTLPSACWLAAAPNETQSAPDCLPEIRWKLLLGIW